MDDDFEKNLPFPRRAPVPRLREGDIDFYQAYRRREKRVPEAPTSARAQTGEIEAVFEQAVQLIDEYAETAERVGAEFDQALLARVVEALWIESSGLGHPLSAISREAPVERFLAESLYHEILEIPAQVCLTAGNQATPLVPHGWRVCLELISDSLSGSHPALADDG